MHQCIRLKLCGLSRKEDIKPMVSSGADALGMVFYPPSKRAITAIKAQELCRNIPALVTTVGLFVNPRPAAVTEILAQVPLDLLQFHGDESADFCRQFKRPYIKAFRVGAPGLDTPKSLLQNCRQFPDAAGWLFDSYTPEFGGSGVAFNLKILKQMHSLLLPSDAPIILAGGLNAKNLKEKIKQFRPYAVDVSSGIELSPGIKCQTKINTFARILNAL